MRPAIRLPLRDTTRGLRMRRQNRDVRWLRVRTVSTAEAPVKPQRLMVPAKPLPLVVPVTSTLSTLFEQVSGSSSWPSLVLSRRSVGAHLDEVATRGDTGLGEVAQPAAWSPWWESICAVAELDSGVAVRSLRYLHGGHHVGGHVAQAVTGTKKPFCIPHLGHAELACPAEP